MENCPSWFCNQWGDPYSFCYFISWVVITALYYGLWSIFKKYLAFKSNKYNDWIVPWLVFGGYCVYLIIIGLCLFESENLFAQMIVFSCLYTFVWMGYLMPIIILALIISVFKLLSVEQETSAD